MKYYQPYQNWYPKIVSIFPVSFGLVIFYEGYRSDSLALVVFGGFLLALGISTIFGLFERYIETDLKKVITRKKWLWFVWENEIPLSQYKYLAVVRRISSSEDSNRITVFWEVNLVSKYAGNDRTGGFSTNICFGSYKKNDGKNVAREFAERISQDIGLRVHIENK